MLDHGGWCVPDVSRVRYFSAPRPRPSLNAGCPPIVSSLYPCDLSCTFIPPFSVFFLGERHFSFASVYFLLSHWLAPTSLLKKRNLLNSQCKPILITLCVLFLGVDSAVRQLDFNLPFLPVNYIKSNPSSPYRTAAIKRAPAPSMSEGAAALTDTTLRYPQAGMLGKVVNDTCADRPQLLKCSALNWRAASIAAGLNPPVPLWWGKAGWQEEAWESLGATCAPYPPWRVMLWQPGAQRESRRRLDPFWNVVVGSRGLRESHDKGRERGKFVFTNTISKEKA